MNLNKEQKSALIGMILGDGYLQKTGEKNSRLRLEHSLKQKEYLLWKVNLLPELFQGKPKILDRIHPITKKTYNYIRHQSNSSPELGKLQKLFYPEGKKKIPENLSGLMRSDISLAIWYLDDGYYYQRDNSMYLYLGKVSKQEAEIANKTISEKFGIQNSILDKKNKGFVLYFSPKEIHKLKLIVEKYIMPSMAYKLPITP